MQVTDDDVKTRAQKEKLEEITADGSGETANGIPKVTREGTMIATAKVNNTEKKNERAFFDQFDYVRLFVCIL